jgi:hypothetical protein
MYPINNHELTQLKFNKFFYSNLIVKNFSTLKTIDCFQPIISIDIYFEKNIYDSINLKICNIVKNKIKKQNVINYL